MNILPMSRVWHNWSLRDEFLLALALKTGDMCHGTVDSHGDTITEVEDLGLVPM